MNKVFIASGYNSWTNKQLTRAFKNEDNADQFMQGLTNPHVQVIAYKNTVELINLFLKEA